MRNRQLLLVALVSSVVMLLSCGGNTQNETKDESQTVEVTTSGKCIAFEIFQKIPKEDLDYHFRDKVYTCPDDCTRHFGDEVEFNDDVVGTERFDVACFPMDNGGWLAVLSSWGCFDFCSYGQGKAYIYKEGQLKAASDMLPQPPYEGKILEDIFYQRHCSDTVLIVTVAGLETDEWGEALLSQETDYVWNGSRFVELSNQVFPSINDKEENAEERRNDTCDMRALYEALSSDDEMFRDFEVKYFENGLHGYTFSRMDGYSASLEVSCIPLASGGFKVVALVNSIEDGEESEYSTSYFYKDGILTVIEDE